MKLSSRFFWPVAALVTAATLFLLLTSAHCLAGDVSTEVGFEANSQANGSKSTGNRFDVPASMSDVSPKVLQELAPTGVLRAAINYGNPVHAQRGPDGGPRGVSVDLAHELARRLVVPVSLVIFDAAGKVFDAIASNAIDVAFLAIDPVRVAQILFTAPYAVIEGTYLVCDGSSLKAIEDFDRKGVRIAVSKGSVYDLFLTRKLKHAELVCCDTPADCRALF